METVNDSVFGEMHYDYAWEKYVKRHMLRRKSEIRVVAVADEGEEILDVQREAYKKYISNEERYIEEIPQALLDYYLDEYDNLLEFCDIPRRLNKKHVNTNTILEMIRVNTLIFDREGNYGYLCDCGWDSENGLAIILSEDEIRIGEQDELI